MLLKETALAKKVLTPQFLGFALVLIALPITLILASTTQSLNQYASTFQSPLLQSTIQKQQTMIKDQTKFLNDLDKSIMELDTANQSNTACSNQDNSTNLTSNIQGVSPTPVDNGSWTADDDIADAQDSQTVQQDLTKANKIQTSSSDTPAVQLQKGADKLSLILDAVKAKTKQHKRHCRHHKKGKKEVTPSPTSSPSTSPKPSKTPKQSPSPSASPSPSLSPSPFPSQ